MSTLKLPPTWLAYTMIGACLIAVLPLPYGYYQLLRIVITGYAAYQAFRFFASGYGGWPWVFAFVALLYNPILIITMSKEAHSVINVLTAGLFLYDLYASKSAADGNSVVGDTASSATMPIHKLSEAQISYVNDLTHRIVRAVANVTVVMLAIVFVVFAFAWGVSTYMR